MKRDYTLLSEIHNTMGLLEGAYPVMDGLGGAELPEIEVELVVVDVLVRCGPEGIAITRNDCLSGASGTKIVWGGKDGLDDAKVGVVVEGDFLVTELDYIEIGAVDFVAWVEAGD